MLTRRSLLKRAAGLVALATLASAVKDEAAQIDRSANWERFDAAYPGLLDEVDAEIRAAKIVRETKVLALQDEVSKYWDTPSRHFIRITDTIPGVDV